MDTGSPDRLIADEVPVVVSWSEADVLPPDSFLQPSRPATVFLSFDDSAKLASCRIRIPFRVKPHAALYALVDPHNVRHVKTVSPLATTVPEPVRNSLVAMGASHGIVGLRFQLSHSPTIIGPASIARLNALGQAGGDQLACLKLVSTARTLTLFVAESDVRMELLSALCAKLPDPAVRASPREHALHAFYDSQGGKDVGAMLAHFTRAENAGGPSVPPPAYEPEPSSAAPASTSNQRSAGKRPASAANSAAPSPKRFDASSPAEVDAPPPLADNGLILTRLDAIDRRLAALETQQAAAITPIAQRLDALAGALADALVPRLVAALQGGVGQPQRQQQQQEGEQIAHACPEQPPQRATKPSGQEVRQQQQARGETTQTQEVPADAALLERRLRRWKGVCLVCKAAGRDDGHSISDCPTAQGRQADEERRDLQSKIKFDNFSGCFWCGVPQAICNGWESNGRKGYRPRRGEECQFKGVMAGVLYGIKHGYRAMWERWMERVASRLEVARVDNEEVIRYFGRQWKENGLESNHLVQEFMWLVGRIEEVGGAGAAATRGEPLRGC